MGKTISTRYISSQKWILWGGSLITLFFWIPLNDPFNAPKSWILSISGFWLLGSVFFQIKSQWEQKTLKWIIILTGGYLLALATAFIATDNKYIGFFGEYQRRTGFLSYFCLLIFFLASSFTFRLNLVSRLEITLLITGFLTAFYGILQHYHHDFVHWNNPYNSLLSSFGNPDFAAAAMSIFFIISFGVLIQSKFVSWLRILALLNCGLLLIAIKFSQVRQGQLTAALGVSIILIIWVGQRKKYFAYCLCFLFGVVGLSAIAGMLNKGPLMRYFYKSSVTFRGDYWRAGWNMFAHHPVFGVGLDRYGAYFRQYRDSTQSLRRGPDIISNAAHNLPIQLAATGGIFLLIAYLVFTFSIAYRGILTLKRTSGSEQILASVILAAWVAYQAQSLISIDNLAVAIWGYILGGAVVGSSLSVGKVNIESQKSKILQPAFSGLLAVVALGVSALFLGAETSMHSIAIQSVPHTQNELSAYKVILQKPLNYYFQEPAFVVETSNLYAQVGDLTTASAGLQKLEASDPRNFEALELEARINEYQKNWNTAITIRTKELSLDPFNYKNLLQLGEDQKNSGNISGAGATLLRINSFASHSEEAKQATKDFKG